MTNILKPKDDRNFPYWPGLPIQEAQSIPGQQVAGEIVDIGINKDRYALAYLVSDIRSIPSPEALQDKTGAAQFIEGQPIMGRGSGVGLTDMLLNSIAQVNTQGKAA